MGREKGITVKAGVLWLCATVVGGSGAGGHRLAKRKSPTYNDLSCGSWAGSRAGLLVGPRPGAAAWLGAPTGRRVRAS
jgi:hypothetical protein